MAGLVAVQVARQGEVLVIVGGRMADPRQHPFEHADEGEEDGGVEDVEAGGVDADRDRDGRKAGRS